jgi:lactate dehydrogenase-like 2-hydroxyacid dehydrogenase
MPTLLQLTTVRPEVQAELDHRYTVHHLAALPEPEAWLAAHAAEIDGAVAAGHGGIPTKLMQQLPNLKIVAINGVGYDRVDLDVAKSLGIRVSNTPDVLTDDVADLAVGLTITLMRRLHHAHGHVIGGRWPAADMPLARKVSGKRFGILGLGRIGLAVARRLSAFDGHIRYTSREAKDVPYGFEPDLLQLAADSDVLVICAAASASTRHAVNRAVIDALGADGVLVNIARGSIVDEDALVAALQEGRLGGAALDVFANEPHVPAALMAMDNVLLTPHIASATDETRRAMGQLMLDNLAAFFAGKPLLTPVV